jgi:hypothetical protein
VKRGVVILLILGLVGICYGEFADSWELNKNASITKINDNTVKIILTPDDGVGSAWFKTPVNLSKDFTITFKVYLGNRDSDGADGVCFVIQSQGTNVCGKTGGGLGYEEIPNSVAIEFDTYKNENRNDISEDHMAIDVDGVTNHNTNKNNYNTPDPVKLGNIEDGNEHTVTVTWDAKNKKLSATFDSKSISWNYDITQIVGKSAYIGFTGATGWYHNLQYVVVSKSDMDFTFVEGTPTKALIPSIAIALILIAIPIIVLRKINS